MALGKVKLPSDQYPGPLQEARTASTAGGGTALTTAAVIVGIPNGTTHLSMVARNAAAANVLKLALNPFLLILTTANNLQKTSDFSTAGQQNPATASAITLNALNTLATGGALYIGSQVQIRGFRVVMSGSVNSIASTLTGNFWNGTAWAALAGFTDGTSAASATFAQNGDIVWTVPTTAKPVILAATQPASVFGSLPNSQGGGITPSQFAAAVPYSDRPRFWYQLVVSAQLSATVAANSFFSLNRNTTQYSEYLFAERLQLRVSKEVDGLGCVEALTDAGTGNLIVDCFTDDPSGGF